MGIKTTADMLVRGEQAQRDLAAAQMGDRLTYRVNFDGNVAECGNCGCGVVDHIASSGILFCAEWALRERYGK